MFTKTQETETTWRYTCDACGSTRVEKYENLRNPCMCNGVVWPKADPRRDLVEPSLIRKAKNYARAATTHVATGSRLCTDEQVAERFAICQDCPLFKPISEGVGVCTHKTCGCSLKKVGVKGKNKLRWAEQICPYAEDENGAPTQTGGIPKPKWLAIPKTATTEGDRPENDPPD